MVADLHEYPSMIAELTTSEFSDEQTQALFEFIGRVVDDSRSGLMEELAEVKERLTDLEALVTKLLLATIGGTFAICVTLPGILATTLPASGH